MFNKIPRKSYILMLLVFALSMMVFPFDVAMEFSAGPEETTLQVFPYFSLTPWGYGNWFPLLAGVLTLAVVVMVFLPPRWKLDKAMAIVLGLSMVCTPLSWLLFNTFADGSVIILLFQTAALLFFLVPGKKPKAPQEPKTK